MLGWCWPAVSDVGPTSTQHWVNVSCLLCMLFRLEMRRLFDDQCHVVIYPNSNRKYSQQTWHIHPLFDQCWASVVDGGPPLIQQWVIDSCLRVCCYVCCWHKGGTILRILFCIFETYAVFWYIRPWNVTLLWAKMHSCVLLMHFCNESIIRYKGC